MFVEVKKESMKLNLKLAQRFFLCAAPLVTGSVFVALPGTAATIAGSESALNLSNFSHNPVGTSTLTRTNTLAISTITEPDGSHELAEGESAEIIPLSVQVAATANALATFPVAPVPRLTEASNITYSLAQGDAEGTGNNYSYLGVAESAAQIVGYNFNVGAGEKFSFDFVSLVSLYTSRDNVISETTNAFSNISLKLTRLLLRLLLETSNKAYLDLFKVHFRDISRRLLL
jgi:hypothetical protein